MSEEAKKEIEALDVDETSSGEPERTEVELEQMEEGWIPPEREDQLNGKKFLTAEEYKERGKFFKKIDSQQKVIDRLENSISHINEHNQRTHERELKKQRAEYEQTIEQLKQEKIAALDEGDSKRVVEIDEAMRKAEMPEPPPPQKAIAPEFEQWKQENQWYDTDKELREYADMIGDGYMVRNPNGSLKALYQFAENEVKARFPDKFENKQRQSAPSVEGGGSPVTKKTTSKLTAEEQAMMDDLGVAGYLKTDADKQKYIKDVIANRD